jgi:hypothetical protein
LIDQERSHHAAAITILACAVTAVVVTVACWWMCGKPPSTMKTRWSRGSTTTELKPDVWVQSMSNDSGVILTVYRDMNQDGIVDERMMLTSGGIIGTTVDMDRDGFYDLEINQDQGLDRFTEPVRSERARELDAKYQRFVEAEKASTP